MLESREELALDDLRSWQNQESWTDESESCVIVEKQQVVLPQENVHQ